MIRLRNAITDHEIDDRVVAPGEGEPVILSSRG